MMFTTNAMPIQPAGLPVGLDEMNANWRRKRPARKGLFGRKAASGMMPPNDGATMAHRGMPAVLQHNLDEMPGLGNMSVSQAQVPAMNHSPINEEGAMQGAGLPARVPQQVAMGGPLGGSMRQPFDYDKAMQVLQGQQKSPKWWQYALAGVGDALVQNSGGQPWATRTLAGQQSDNAERLRAAAEQLIKWQHDDWARQNEADLRASAPFTVGRDRVSYDPATGQANVLYNGPEDFELYAQQLGLEPGSDDYYEAVEDYVLRSSGPSAYGRDVSLDDHRTANDRSLEQYRFGNRTAMERLRQVNRQGMVDYRNANPAPSRASGAKGDTALPVVSSPAEAKRLPSGTRFRTPDGKVKVVP